MKNEVPITPAMFYTLPKIQNGESPIPAFEQELVSLRENLTQFLQERSWI